MSEFKCLKITHFAYLKPQNFNFNFNSGPESNYDIHVHSEQGDTVEQENFTTGKFHEFAASGVSREENNANF